MTCNNQGAIGKITDISQPAIVKGSDAFIEVQIVYQDSGEPYPIGAFVSCTGYFKQATGSLPLEITGTLVSQDLAKIRLAIPSAQSALLFSGEEISFEIRLEAAEILWVIFDSQLTIRDRIF